MFEGSGVYCLLVETILLYQEETRALLFRSRVLRHQDYRPLGASGFTGLLLLPQTPNDDSPSC